MESYQDKQDLLKGLGGNNLEELLRDFLEDKESETLPRGFSEAPVSTKGKALGYRTWHVDYDRNKEFVLAPLHKKSKNWHQGINTAYCNASLIYGMHSSSEHSPCGRIGCRCGFNAWNKVEESLESGGTEKCIYGAISGWGKMQIHEDGWRSEYAEIIALYVDKRYLCKRFRLTETDNLDTADFNTYGFSIGGGNSKLKFYKRKTILKEIENTYEVPVFTSLLKFNAYVKEQEKLITPEW